MTAWREVIAVMDQAGIADGPHKTPKGLRHGYGVHAISSGVPLNMLSKSMGHASLEITAIYANSLGEEQRNIAARMWGVIKALLWTRHQNLIKLIKVTFLMK